MHQQKLDKDDTSYSDEYDRETVEQCRALEKRMTENKSLVLLKNLALYFLCGERYAHKWESINSRKKALQDYYQRLENAQPKFNVLCLVCRSNMDVLEKTLHGHDRNEQVLFYFKCRCGEMRRFFQDGTEYRPKPPSCSKCSTELKKESCRRGNKIITSYTCGNCDYHEENVLDLDEIPSKPKVDKDFLKDRQRFCLTEEKGREYWEHCQNFPIQKPPSKEVTALQTQTQIKVLNVVQAQELLIPVFQQNGFKDLSFGKPEVFRGSLMLPYTAQDTLSERDNKKAVIEIKKLIEQTFEGTNWRNTSEEITYFLGLVSGRIRGFETKFDKS